MNTLTCQVCGFIWTPKFKKVYKWDLEDVR